VRTAIGVAIDIPEPWCGELTRHRAAAGDPAAGSIPAHLTLLGPTEVDVADLPVIEHHLGRVAAAHPPFVLRLRGTGSFRPLTEVVYVAVAGGVDECAGLATAVRELPLVDQAPRYPYHPHVTVAQDVPAEALDMVLADLAGFAATFVVDRFTLFEHDGEIRWRPRTRFALGAA